MARFTLRNYRCFRDKQAARLAPLTLLVGENSSGKTSFMAMVRALWEVAFRQRAPDFKEDPYDLGSFDEIVYQGGGKSRPPAEFEAGVDLGPQAADGRSFRFEVTFGKRGTMPAPIRMQLSDEAVSVEAGFDGCAWHLSFRTAEGSWKSNDTVELADTHYTPMSPIWHLVSLRPELGDRQDTEVPPSPASSKKQSHSDRRLIDRLIESYRKECARYDAGAIYASAPVRSKPLRTYDPWHSTRDPEGDHAPTYLAGVYSQDKRTWDALKANLEKVGKDAGLFDEVAIAQLGNTASSPFQVRVRKFGSRTKGPWRNLLDVGYGVSQALPVITELLRPDAPAIYLLQQPEVHLHPSAQAALGSLFCRVATPERQLIVETHSDHLFDRVRMDVRDGIGSLKPDDVSILFFERGDMDARIHSLRIDEAGNVLNAPPGYRQFFMNETTRSLMMRREFSGP